MLVHVTCVLFIIFGVYQYTKSDRYKLKKLKLKSVTTNYLRNELNPFLFNIYMFTTIMPPILTFVLFLNTRCSKGIYYIQHIHIL